MKRIKSIDILRGLSMTWMVIGHLLAWWIRGKDRWVYLLTFEILDPIGAAAFLLVAGISTAISYRTRLAKIEITEGYTKNNVRNEYMLRAFFIFIVAILFNLFIAIAISDPEMIWTWFILLTIAISLFIAWPLLETPKLFRIFLGALFWILHLLLLDFLSLFKGEPNLYGVLYHILYNIPRLDPILPMFPFFLFGTILGEILHDIYLRENHSDIKLKLKKKFLRPLIILGPVLIICGILYDFPAIPRNRSFIWLIYSLGIQLTILSIFVFFEEFVFYKVEKSYKFLFYYSYYSLVIYLTHNPLYFLFYRQLNMFEIWIFIAVTFIIIGLIFRFIYKRWGYKASLKTQIGRLASGIAKKIEEKKV
ncbi:MAG: heparan-alpha-glucosaminide N-acetyltransferase domain-containing protein [Candidatus Hodarchaeota archaeon]